MSGDTEELSGSLVFDTGILVEYFVASPIGKMVERHIERLGPEDSIHLHVYTISELFYILCRMKGSNFASTKLKEMLNSSFISVHSSVDLALTAGELKCARSLSIADCSCLAIAELLGIPAVFRIEEELQKEISRKPFSAKIILLGD